MTKLFGDFVAKKHGSLQAALKLYDTKWESNWDLKGEDSLEKGTVGLLQPWFMSEDARDRAKRWEDPTIDARVIGSIGIFDDAHA